MVILDGWGIGEPNQANPIYAANPAAIHYAHSNFPAGALQASGIAVGLPWGEEGNSEIGHLTLGIGRVIYQHYPKITMSIEDGQFFENKALKSAFKHGKSNNSSVHLLGLISKGNIHASLNHIVSLLELAKKEEFSRVYLHLFSDGRDSPPNSVAILVGQLEEKIKNVGTGKISSISGRYYAMNRDGHWERTKAVYDLITGITVNKEALESAANKVIQKKLTDEYILPFATENFKPVEDNDAVIFFNFREDGIGQLASAFIDKAFDKFPTKELRSTHLVTMTKYLDNLPLSQVAYPPENIKNTLGETLADQGKIQLRIAERQKYAHVTYFFNGLKDKSESGEYRVLIPTEEGFRPEQNPAMSAAAITERVILALKEKSFDFILANYANPDVLAHTGNYNATLEAIKVTDREVGKLIKTVIAEDQILIITSDHGNAEVILDPSTGSAQTRHDSSPVPFYVIAKEFFRKRREPNSQLSTIGILSDVAPTILELMKIPAPGEMTGQNLMNQII